MFNVDVHKQVMIGCVDFSQFTDENGDNDMYNALKEEMSKPKNSGIDYIIFDKTNQMIWIFWYERGSV